MNFQVFNSVLNSKVSKHTQKLCGSLAGLLHINADARPSRVSKIRLA